MQLENVTAQVRPRQSWEAMDLGFMMVQQWWAKLAVSWVVLTLPIFLLINLLLREQAFWAALLFWWLKPIYERVPLHILSRALFGEMVTTRQAVRAIPGLILPNLIKMLTYLRFNPARSFDQPVWQLERLKGHERAERARVLKKRAGGSAFALLLMCMLIELILFLGLLGLVMMFTPDSYSEQVWQALNPRAAEHSWWAGLTINGFIYLAMFIVGPFYAAGGFALYINRRTQLEGWDIEIVFRRLAQRVGNAQRVHAALLLILLSLGALPGTLLMPHPAQAETVALSNADAKKAIDEILSSEDFSNKKKVSRWEYKPSKKEKDKDADKKKDDEDKKSFLDGLNLSFGLGTLGEFVLWFAVAALVVLGIVAYLRWAPSLGRTNGHDRSKLPRSLFGMEITPESLPEDVSAVALALWKSDPLQALSLLYRAALTTLVHRDGINLKGSATEGDCIRLLEWHGQHVAQATQDYFRELTRAWQLAAYAHRLPDAEMMSGLSRDWPQHFGEAV